MTYFSADQTCEICIVKTSDALTSFGLLFRGEVMKALVQKLQIRGIDFCQILTNKSKSARRNPTINNPQYWIASPP